MESVFCGFTVVRSTEFLYWLLCSTRIPLKVFRYFHVLTLLTGYVLNLYARYFNVDYYVFLDGILFYVYYPWRYCYP
jgi:hypothetical protein